MVLLYNFLFTLSTFTKIPTPQIEYNEENTKYTFFCFPLVGLVLGVINYLSFLVLSSYISESFVIAIIMILININITGGIHMDGYIDSMDAFKSYRSYEEKKKIIKDSRVGAFGMIHYISIILIYLVVYFFLAKYHLAIIFLLMPIISRTIILFLVCNNEKEPNDMLDDLISPLIEDRYLMMTIIYFVLTFVLSVLLSPINAIILVGTLFLGAILYALYFNFMFKNHFKAMSGDLCGYYIIMAEAIAPIAFIIVSLVFILN
ncbi:adenosylcobinamide-GDP ribazoletransferase [Bacilli bacterium PM5-3]|nr:adenosylcobinamide-GDP ribazoletransferase [Bacilli bacterium PM5-3]MDH6604176.1 adenosylcobinamide-GDP ribazoletransferase [Bacilli bacterium PM5-9]